jgi:N-methylhydantoinase A
MKGEQVASDNLRPLYDRLQNLGEEALTRDGISEKSRRFARTADLRYGGQAYEVNVPVPDGPLDAAALDTMRGHFHALHKQLYAHNHVDKPVEFVSARLTALGLTSAPSMRVYDESAKAPASKETHKVYFEETGSFEDTPVYDRATLSPGSTFDGPAIVEQIDTTVVIHPGQAVCVDKYRNLLINTGGDNHAR